MDKATELFLDKGILGVVVVILLFALRHIFMLYVAAQEKRIAEAASNAAIIANNTQVMSSLVDYVKAKV